MRNTYGSKVISLLLLGLILSFFSTGLSAQNLEIHYINVQQGQSTLIIGPNGTKILYDGGYEFKGTTEVVPYLQSLGITASQPIDYMIASHRHTDHYIGLTETINYGYDALNVYDNGSNYSNTYVDAFLSAAGTTTAGGVTAMTLGQVIDLGSGATATCVAVNGSVIGVGPIAGGTNNENDRSICLLIKYGNFDFILTGDVGGGEDDNSCTGRGTSQVNIETPMSMAITPGGANPLLTAYGVEVAHVSHHGSESSTNSDYMNLLSPTVACISVGDGQATNWYHPRADVVDNVLLAGVSCITVPPALVLQSEEGNPGGGTASTSGYCVGDIVITTDGGTTYTVSASGAVSQGPDERSAAGLPQTFTFDEVGGGDLPPVISNINEQNVTQTSAGITWTTNENADSVVRYGTSPGSYTQTQGDSAMVLSHSVSLTGLTEGITYYYVVESTDSGSNTTTSAEQSFSTGSTGGDSGVVFSEIFYDTPGTDADEEWIELYNNTASTVDIGGWTITDNNGTGSTYTFPGGTTIAAGTYFTVAANSTGFNALYGFDGDLYGSIPALNNTGDTLLLKNGSGTLTDTVAWEGGASSGIPSGWGSTSAPSASTGNSIVRTDPTVDSDTYSDWTAASNNGDPQTQGSNPPTGGDIVFSEIFYDTPGTDADEEWIELYNKGASTVDIGGWTITDNNGTGSSYTFPAGTTIAAGTYFTVAANSTGFNAIYGYNADLYGTLPFLNNSGDTLLLTNNSAEEVDAVAWEGGASSGVPATWASSTAPSVSTGGTIVRTDPSVDTDTYADWSTASNNGDPQTQGGAVSPPAADFSASATTVTEGDSITFTDSSTNSPTSWSWTFAGGTPGTGTAQNPVVTFDTAGTYTITLEAANAGGSDTETKTNYITVEPASTGMVFETGNLSNVGSSWQTVTLTNTYTSMVVVCSSDNGPSGLPAVTRVRNASGNSFEVMVQNPSGTALSGYAVHYLAVEEGVYNVADHGVKLEAVKASSTQTANNSSWVLETRTYQNSYTNPVVVGQVMTYNDANWSVFWACGSSRTSPPTASAFTAGKNIGEDPNRTRVNETIGYVVIEQGSGAINGISYNAALGSDIVRGPDNTSTGYTYTFGSIPTAATAIVSTAAMDGNNGGWPVMYGSSPLTSTSLLLVFEEDQVKDSERKHATEQVAYIVFGQ